MTLILLPRGVTNHQWFECFDFQTLDLWIDLLVFWATGFDLSIWFALRSDLNWFELKFRMNWFEIQIKCKSLALPNLINSTYQLPTIIMIDTQESQWIMGKPYRRMLSILRKLDATSFFLKQVWCWNVIIFLWFLSLTLLYFSNAIME